MPPLRAIADAYFSGLVSGDLSAVPYSPQVRLHTPLAPGGSPVAIVGKDAVLAFFAGLFDAIDACQVHEYFFNEAGNALCARADVRLKSGAVLRVADIFRLDSAGLVVEQENHYDPRPAL